MSKIYIVLFAFAVVLSSCRSAAPRAPAVADDSLFPSDSYHYTGRTEKMNGKEFAVHVSEDDARNCAMSLKLTEGDVYRCDLRNALIPAGSATVLRSETAFFDLYYDQVSGRSIKAYLNPDFVTIKVTARTMNEASHLLREQFKPNMHKLRTVKYVVFEKGK
jgi:hypothetical protein